ncbi:MAG: sulfite exporter TauE/SafE family protein, partial [Gemmatimonadota bacterium]
AFAPAAILSTYLGARLAQYVPDVVQLVALGVVMLPAAIMMWKGAPPLSREGEGDGGRGRRPSAVIAIGVALGLLTGIVGVGGGFLIVPALVLLLGLDMKKAVGTSLGVISLNAASGFAGYLGQVTMDWTLMAGFTGVAVAGVFGGAALVPMVSQQQLRRGFALFLIAVAAYILYRR